MISAIELMIQGVWSVMSIEIPVTGEIEFTLWQYFLFLFIMVVFIKLLFGIGGGD